MLIHTKLTNLVLAKDFAVVHIFKDSNLNINKLWIAPLPSFNEINFPFLVVSGSETLNLINVKETRMEVLLKQPGKYMKSQAAAFFDVEVNNGFNMHFASYESNGHVRMETWHRMAFKKDFIDMLKVYGRLPFATI